MTQQQPQQQQSAALFSPQTQQAIARISLRMDDLAQSISQTLNAIIAEKDQKIRELETKLAELQTPIKTKQT
ncbi:MAG: hypothetical protein LBC12_00385 [Nitrososphaerota archaeon]|jgi:prefoldin subunit 5|nr:hypothetical protein [Nitrososphaerota archaeon]